MKTNRKRIAMLILLLFALQFFPVFKMQVSAESSLEEAKEGVVQVLSVCYKDGVIYGYRNSTGFAVGELGEPVQFILTNYYIIDPDVWPKGSDIQVFVGVDDDLLDVSNIYRNSESNVDIVLLELEKPITNRKNLCFYPSDSLTSVQPVYSISYKDLFSDDGEYMFYLENIVIDSGQLIDANFLAPDQQYYMEISITPHNDTFYGGPLVTEEGYVVGINTNYYSDDQGVRRSLEIPSDYLIDYLMGIDIVPIAVHNTDVEWSPSPFGKALTISSVATSQYTLKGKCLSGSWGEQVSTKTNNSSFQDAFYLDTPLYNCTELTVEIEIEDYTGYIFDWWYLDARDLNGKWSHVGSFKLDKEAVGNTKSYIVKLNKPTDLDALSVVLASKYNSCNCSYTLYFKDPQ